MTFYRIGIHIPGEIYFRSNNYRYTSKAAAIKRAKRDLKYTAADRVTVERVDNDAIYTEIFKAEK